MWIASLPSGSWSLRGMFYGEGGGHFVRVALTSTDERITAAAQRLERS